MTIIVSNILIFIAKYKLTLIDAEIRNNKNCYESNINRSLFSKLKNKDLNWFNTLENNFYSHYLNDFIVNVSKLIVFKQLVENFEKDIYKRFEKLIIFINFSIINYIVFLIDFFFLSHYSFHNSDKFAIVEIILFFAKTSQTWYFLIFVHRLI